MGEDAPEDLQTTDGLVGIWLTDLTHLAYDLEDLLDELATEISQRNKMEHQGDRPSKVRKIFSSLFAAVDRRSVESNMEMNSKIDSITERLDEIIRQKDDLNLRDSTTRMAVQENESPPLTSLVIPARVYGREDDKKAVLELLKPSATDAADISVIPIIGMGGVGKTTLAQLIYNDSSLQIDFKAWVSVGCNFDIIRITNTILQSVHGNDKDLDFLQVQMKQKLSGKKFLLVLDDVWSKNYEQWTLFLTPFEAGAPGSRILITTRSRDVSTMMAGTAIAHLLKELPYDECRSVFCQHALGAINFDQHSEVRDIGEKIVERCKGLPLAAKALGGLLRGKLGTSQWEEILTSEIWDLPDNIVLPALRLSYLYLPSHLKRCFSYCSVFPKGYEFDRNELALLWRAEGFLSLANKVRQRDDLGDRYFDELLSRSFFQESSDNKSRYVMHDIIHDLAVFVSRGTCSIMVGNELEGSESYASVRHSSFIRQSYNTSRRFEVFHKMTKLRTFMSLHPDPYGSYISRNVLHDLLPKLKFLRVLSLKYFLSVELPSCLGELSLLRYLDLSFTQIERLPESVGNLINLETLLLKGCSLFDLPESICSLTKLLYLDISETNLLRKMPVHIGNLKSLRMLTKFTVGEGSDAAMASQIKSSSGVLPALKRLNISGCQEAVFRYLCDVPCLTELKINNIRGLLQLDDSYMQALLALQKLEISHCAELKYLWADGTSLDCLASLKNLEIFQCKKLVSLVNGAEGMFPINLENLQLVSCDSLKELPNGLNRLKSLTTLRIFGCPELVKSPARGLPRSIRTLQISNCPSLEVVFSSEMPNLEKLQVSHHISVSVRCSSNARFADCLVSLDVGKGAKQLLDALHFGFSHLKELKINECDDLESFPERELPNVSSLVSLNISNCKRLKSLSYHMRSFHSLQFLEISFCEEFDSLPDMGSRNPCLVSVSLCYCCKLRSLPKEMQNFTCLQYLHLAGTGISCLQGCLPPKLTELKITDCKNLREEISVWGLHALTSLTRLTITLNTGTVSFPDNDGLLPSSLTRLCISDFKNMESVGGGIRSLISLESLFIADCPKLKSFSAENLPPTLESVYICNCPLLQDWCLKDRGQFGPIFVYAPYWE